MDHQRRDSEEAGAPTEPASSGLATGLETRPPDSESGSTRRGVLRNAAAFGGLTAVPDVFTGAVPASGSGRTGLPTGGPLDLEYVRDDDRDAIPLPPTLPLPFLDRGEIPDPVVDVDAGARASAVETSVRLGSIGAIVSAASPKLGADVSVSEPGEYRVTASTSVSGASTFARRGDGVLVALNYVRPRLCVEGGSLFWACRNGFPDPLQRPRPHARMYGQQFNDLIDLFGGNLLRRQIRLALLPDVVQKGLAILGKEAAENLFVPEPSTGRHPIEWEADLETTFDADAAGDYRVWHCFDVVVWALGRPDVDVGDIEWGDVLNEELWEEFEWDGEIVTRVEAECEVDGLSVDRIGDPSTTDPVGRALRVTKAGTQDGLGAYFVRTDRAIDQAVDSEALVVGSTAVDWVGPESGEDNLHLRGEVTEFLLKGEAAVYHDGSRVAPGEFGRSRPNDVGDLSNTLTVESTGTGLGAFAVTVTGELAHGDDSEAVIRGRSALDWVGPETGTDELRFSGAIQTLVLKGDARVFVNGERVYPPIYRPELAGGGVTRTLTVAKDDTPEGLGVYAVTVTGDLQRTADSEAFVGGQTALDWVGPQTGVDTLHFTGDVEQFLFKGDANVYLDDAPVDPGTLGTARSEGTGDGSLPNTLTVTKDGVEEGLGAYVVTVSDSIAGGRDSEALVEGRRALDWVGPTSGTDELRYAGDITNLVVKGPAAVYRNGERLDV